MKIDEEVARAYTLPASMYLDPAVLAQEDDRIFARTWQLVAHISELARPGDFKPTNIIDEPILLTHAQDGKLHGFYNVCRHRAAQAVTTRSRATGRCTRTTPSRPTPCQPRPGACSRSWSTTTMGWSPFATTRSSTRPFES